MSTTTIISLVGEAWIRSQDGSLREATLGSSIVEGETIITGENARVVLDFGGGMDTALIDGGAEINIPIGEGSSSDESLEEGQVERLMALLGKTDGDIQDQLAPPSSGSRSDGNADNGHSFVRLLRIVEELTPLKYQFDLRSEEALEPRTGIADLADDNPADGDQDVSLSGVAPLGTFTEPADNSPGGGGAGSVGANGALPPSAQWAQLVVGEAGLPGGSADDGSGISQSGVFGFSSPDGLAELTFGDSLVLSLADLRGLEAAPLAVVTDHGTVWLDGFTGDSAGGEVSYHFELESAVDNDREPGASDGGYLERVAVSVTDVDGSHAGGSLGILILDDIPTNQVQGPANVAEGETVVGTWSREAGADGEDATVVFVGGDDTSYGLGTLIPTAGGMLLVNQDGSWSFDAAPGSAGGEDVIFRLVTTDLDGDRADTMHRVRITPDTSPVTPDSDGDASTLPVTTTLDEDGLPGGIAGGKGDAPGEAVVTTGSLNYAFGEDGPAADGAFAWSVEGLPTVTSDGQSVTYTVSDDGLVLEATDETGAPVLTVKVTDVDSGTYEATLHQGLDHSDATSEDDIDLTFTYTLTDGDGSTAKGTLTVVVDDDMPSIVAGVDDDVSEVNEGDIVTGTWGVEGGGDGASPPVIRVPGDVTPYAPGDSIDTGHGILVVDPDGTWTFTADPGEGEPQTPTLDVTLTVTDNDGDEADTTIVLPITPDTAPVTPDSDGDPTTESPTLLLDEDGLEDGIKEGEGDRGDGAVVATGELGFDYGADGPAQSGAFAWSLDGLPAMTSHEKPITYSLADEGLTVKATDSDGNAVFSVTVTDVEKGSVEATLYRDVDHDDTLQEDDIDVTLGYSITDGDGSTAVGHVNVVINDDAPSIGPDIDLDSLFPQTAAQFQALTVLRAEPVSETDSTPDAGVLPGAEVFAWELGQTPQAEPAMAAADGAATLAELSLELGDLIDDSGENALSDYLLATQEGDDTVVFVKSGGGLSVDGSNADQQLTLAGVDMGGDSDAFLARLLDNGAAQVE